MSPILDVPLAKVTDHGFGTDLPCLWFDFALLTVLIILVGVPTLAPSSGAGDAIHLKSKSSSVMTLAVGLGVEYCLD